MVTMTNDGGDEDNTMVNNPTETAKKKTSVGIIGDSYHQNQIQHNNNNNSSNNRRTIPTCSSSSSAIGSNPFINSDSNHSFFSSFSTSVGMRGGGNINTETTFNFPPHGLAASPTIPAAAVTVSPLFACGGSGDGINVPAFPTTTSGRNNTANLFAQNSVIADLFLSTTSSAPPLSSSLSSATTAGIVPENDFYQKDAGDKKKEEAPFSSVKAPQPSTAATMTLKDDDDDDGSEDSEDRNNNCDTTTTTTTNNEQQQDPPSSPEITNSLNQFSALSISESDSSDDNDEDDSHDDDDDDDDDDESYFPSLSTIDDDDDDDDDEDSNSSFSDEDDDDDDDDDDDEDDDDEDDDDEAYERGLFMSWLARTEMIERDRRSSNEDCEDQCTCHGCRIERFGIGDDDDDDDDDNDDVEEDIVVTAGTASSSQQCCAICMEPESSKRKFVHLPCCAGRSSSSMQFCQKCLVLYLAKNGSFIPTEPDDNNDAVLTARTDDDVVLAGECPRCKHLVVLQLNDNKYDDEDGDDNKNNTIEGEKEIEKKKDKPEYVWNGSRWVRKWKPSSVLNAKSAASATPAEIKEEKPYHERIVAKKASTWSMFWYIGTKNTNTHSGRLFDSLDSYCVELLTLAYTLPHYIPEELILNDSGSIGRIQQLRQWGVLSQKKTRQQEQRNEQQSRNKVTAYLTSTVDRVSELTQHGISRMQQWSVEKFLPSWITKAQQDLPNKNGLIYQINPSIQAEMRSLFIHYLMTPTFSDDDDDNSTNTSSNRSSNDDEVRELHLRSPHKWCHNIDVVRERNERRQCMMMSGNCAGSAVMAAQQLRFSRVLHLVNLGIILLMLSSRFLLPPLHAWKSFSLMSGLRGIVSAARSTTSNSIMPSNKKNNCIITHIYWYHYTIASGLNVMWMMMAYRILIQVVWILYYVVMGYLCVQLVGSCLVTPKSQLKKWTRNLFLSYMVLCYLPIYGIMLNWYYRYDASIEIVVPIGSSEEEMQFVGKQKE